MPVAPVPVSKAQELLVMEAPKEVKREETTCVSQGVRAQLNSFVGQMDGLHSGQVYDKE